MVMVLNTRAVCLPRNGFLVVVLFFPALNIFLTVEETQQSLIKTEGRRFADTVSVCRVLDVCLFVCLNTVSITNRMTFTSSVL